MAEKTTSCTCTEFLGSERYWDVLGREAICRRDVTPLTRRDWCHNYSLYLRLLPFYNLQHK
jgi:hypothetical protein